MSEKTMVCRCEDVTLREVQEAIEKGYRDIESVKRFTGFGTGFCQGKQCMQNVAKCLAAAGNPQTAPFTPRPPVHPIAFADLAALLADDDA